MASATGAGGGRIGGPNAELVPSMGARAVLGRREAVGPTSLGEKGTIGTGVAAKKRSKTDPRSAVCAMTTEDAERN
jgi:hypothetical protein